MRNIPLKQMLELWDRLLWLEKASDFELAQRAGLSYGTVGAWRSANPPKSVRLSTLGQIEEKLGYEINLKANGRWDIRKLGGEPSAKEPEAIYFSMPGHITEEERERYRELLKRLEEIPPGEVETVKEVIDLVFKRTGAEKEKS